MNKAMTTKTTTRCRKHEWRYTGCYGHPRGSRYGTVMTQRCEVCLKTRKWVEK